MEQAVVSMVFCVLLAGIIIRQERWMSYAKELRLKTYHFLLKDINETSVMFWKGMYYQEKDLDSIMYLRHRHHERLTKFMWKNEVDRLSSFKCLFLFWHSFDSFVHKEVLNKLRSMG